MLITTDLTAASNFLVFNQVQPLYNLAASSVYFCKVFWLLHNLLLDFCRVSDNDVFKLLGVSYVAADQVFIEPNRVCEVKVTLIIDKLFSIIKYLTVFLGTLLIMIASCQMSQ